MLERAVAITWDAPQTDATSVLVNPGTQLGSTTNILYSTLKIVDVLFPPGLLASGAARVIIRRR